MTTAKITSLDALLNFKVALLRFSAEVEAALVTLELEARRPMEWIEGDRARYWPQQVRKASDATKPNSACNWPRKKRKP